MDLMSYILHHPLLGDELQRTLLVRNIAIITPNTNNSAFLPLIEHLFAPHSCELINDRRFVSDNPGIVPR